MKTLYFFIVPIAYVICLMIAILMFMIKVFVDHASIYDAITVCLMGLGNSLVYVGLVAFGFTLLVTVMQIAMIELGVPHVTCGEVWIRFFTASFCLCLTPLACIATSTRLTVQKFDGVGFMNLGSLAYLASAGCVVGAVILWRRAADPRYARN